MSEREADYDVAVEVELHRILDGSGETLDEVILLKDTKFVIANNHIRR